MIDLREGLPDSLISDGESYRVFTDFRVWLRFEMDVEDRVSPFLLTYIFADEVPSSFDWVESAVEFLNSQNQTPRPSASLSVDKVLDYFEDGDYIYASFLQAYGIDLVDVDHLHWHKFQALMRSLPEDTKLSQIMGYRSWRNDKRKHETVMRELKNVWELRSKTEQEEHDEMLKWQNEVFFGA
jgi:hypothetical protein